MVSQPNRTVFSMWHSQYLAKLTSPAWEGKAGMLSSGPQPLADFLPSVAVGKGGKKEKEDDGQQQGGWTELQW